MTIEKGKDWLQRYTKASGREHPFEKVAREAAARRGDPRGNLRPNTSNPKVNSPAFEEQSVSNLGADFMETTGLRMARAHLHPYADPATITEISLPEHLKHAVVQSLVDDLSETETGVPYNTMSEMIHQWAITSNDSSERSLSIQQAAAEEFGVPLSDWQKKHMNEIPTQASIRAAKKAATQAEKDVKAAYARYLEDYSDEALTKYNEARERAWDLAGKAKALKQWSDPYQLGHVLKGVPGAKKVLRTVLRKMYERTQEQFREAGIKEIVLYRGYKPDGKQMPMGNATVRGNALESWSSSYRVASRFGNQVITARIPVSRILSTPASGFGCFREQEFVVLAPTKGTDTVYVTDFGPWY